MMQRAFRRLPWAMFVAASARAADAPEMRAVEVSASAWYVQGESALGSSANRNLISDAGFVATPAGEVVIDALGIGREYLGAEAERRRLQASIDDGPTKSGTQLIRADTWLDGSASFDAGGVRFEALPLF